MSIEKHPNLGKVYYEKARARLFWLIIFSFGGVVIFFNSSEEGLKLLFVFLAVSFLACRALLKNYPLVPIIFTGLAGLGLSYLIIMIGYWFFSDLLTSDVNDLLANYSLELLAFVFFTYINYLLWSTFYFSIKILGEKVSLNKSYHTLDEDEIFKNRNSENY